MSKFDDFSVNILANNYHLTAFVQELQYVCYGMCAADGEIKNKIKTKEISYRLWSDVSFKPVCSEKQIIKSSTINKLK